MRTDVEAEVGDNGVRVVLQLQLEGQRGEPAHSQLGGGPNYSRIIQQLFFHE
jgi:hypothetical protein